MTVSALFTWLTARLAREVRRPSDRQLADFLQRFWSRVEKTDACWIWTRYRRNGYGSISLQDVEFYAHQASYLLHFGAIPDGQFVLHECDNTGCVRPDHLFLGTQIDNVADMVAKERGKPPPIARGFAHPKARHPDDVVRNARALRAAGVPQREVATRLGTSQSTVWRWTHGRTRTA